MIKLIAFFILLLATVAMSQIEFYSDELKETKQYKIFNDADCKEYVNKVTNE